MNIITEHKYDAARWSTDEQFWDRERILVSDVIERHNISVILLQGDHDEEVELLRHQIADLKRDLNYARAAVSALKHKGEK